MADRHVGTEYRVQYTDELAVGPSGFKFSFSDNIARRAEKLGVDFHISDDLESVEFFNAGAPTNVIGTIVFEGPDGYQVGSMPVSLAIPSD